MTPARLSAADVEALRPFTDHVTEALFASSGVTMKPETAHAFVKRLSRALAHIEAQDAAARAVVRECDLLHLVANERCSETRQKRAEDRVDALRATLLEREPNHE